VTAVERRRATGTGMGSDPGRVPNGSRYNEGRGEDVLNPAPGGRAELVRPPRYRRLPSTKGDDMTQPVTLRIFSDYV
jgi:hypothetical protein